MNHILPRVRKDMGYPPLVTPTSQIVGIQSVMNVLGGERYKTVSNEVKEYMKGMYGKSPAPVNAAISKRIIGDDEVITCRPADLLEPEFDKFKSEGEKEGFYDNFIIDKTNQRLYKAIFNIIVIQEVN